MKKLISNLILLTITLVVCLTFLEIAVRVAGVASIDGYPDGLYQNDELLDYKLIPGASGELIKPEFRTSFKINSLGMNDYEYGEKSSNDYRILALGDSFVWGAYGTELSENFLKILEVKLNENKAEISNRNYQIMKAGVPGYGTDQELLYLKNTGIELKPDLILLNFYMNDFDDNMIVGEREANTKGQLVVKHIKKQNILQLTRNFLFNHLHSYRFMERAAVNIMGPKLGSLVGGDVIYNTAAISNIYEEKYSEQALSKVGKTFILIEEMNQFAKQNNIPFIVVLIPAKFQVYPDLQQDIVKQNHAIEYDFSKPNQMIIIWAEKKDIIVIDLLPEFTAHNEKDLYWTLNPHWNKLGNRQAAERIYRGLVEQKIVQEQIAIK